MAMVEGPFAPQKTTSTPPNVAKAGRVDTDVDTETDPDEALRTAIKAAVDAGDFDRARALVAILEAAPKPAPVVDLATRRSKS
jgi:hypothetical protein